jgi:hypothetical protein
MNDTMSLLFVTGLLAAGGLGLYMYKSSDDNQKGDDDYNENTLFGSGSLFGSSEDEEFKEEEEEVEFYQPKVRSKTGKTKRNKKIGGTKRRY